MKRFIIGASLLGTLALGLGIGFAVAQVSEPREKVLHVPDLASKNLAPGITNRAVTGDLVMMIYNDLAAGAIVPEHNHAAEQISYVVSGRIKFTFDGREHVLGPGDAIVIPSHVVHGAVLIEDTRTIEAFGPPHPAFLDIAGQGVRGK